MHDMRLYTVCKWVKDNLRGGEANCDLGMHSVELFSQHTWSGVVIDAPGFSLLSDLVLHKDQIYDSKQVIVSQSMQRCLGKKFKTIRMDWIIYKLDSDQI